MVKAWIILFGCFSGENFLSQKRRIQNLVLGEHFVRWERHRVGVATMTRDHDDTPHAIFNTTRGTCRKVSEVIDFDLKNQNSNLLACFSALICDFSQFNKIPLPKTTKTRVLRVLANLLSMDSWKWGEWALYKFICLEIIFLLIYHIQLRTSQLWNQERAMIFEARVYMTHWTNCHLDTLFRTWLK